MKKSANRIVIYRPPLKRPVLRLCILFTRKRVDILFQAYWVFHYIVLQLLPYVFCYFIFILSHCVYIVASASEMSVPVFVLQIRMPVKYHQAALSL